MANRYAIATGNWSNPAIWDGGVALPTIGDVVRANGFIVTIDQDVDVDEFRWDAAAPAVANGTFLVSTIPGGGRSINALLTGPGAATGAYISVTAAANTLTITGNINGGGGDNGQGVVYITGNATLNVVGNVTNTTGAGRNSIASTGTGTITVTGNVTTTGASTVSPAGIYATGNLDIIINGNVTGGTVNVATAIVATHISSTVTVNGNIYGGSGASGQAISCPGVIVINGDVTGGNNSATAVTIASTTSTLTVTGTTFGGSGTNPGAGVAVGNASAIAYLNDVIAGTVTAGVGTAAVTMSTGAIDISGTITASLTMVGVSTSGGMLRPRGPMIDASNGRAAVLAAFVVFPKQPVKTSMQMRGDAGFPTIGGIITLANFEDNGLPDPANVRIGVAYGPDDSLIGTSYPALTVGDVWSYLTADADVPDSMGLRLRNAATVASTGSQITALMTS